MGTAICLNCEEPNKNVDYEEESFECTECGETSQIDFEEAFVPELPNVITAINRLMDRVQEFVEKEELTEEEEKKLKEFMRDAIKAEL